MDTASSKNNNYVFGLDIGTRSIVGVVGYMDNKSFHIIAMAQKEHETRAMLDGQIHDIYKVGDTIRFVKNELEKQLGNKLTDVCIAAAGRVLKTINANAEYEFEEETRVTQEHIYSLDLLAVEKAHMQINEKSDNVRFYCVGNSPVKYQLNGFDINNLEGHKANKISVELIATFLPEEVVDGLYEAVEYAGLHVASLTLEPIAAMNVAIPERYRLLNIGLIDVGAGTSDICITKDGSVIAYGMIPLAGDELTETIAKNYLVDFNTAEEIKIGASDKKKGNVTFKDIMGLTQKIPCEEVLNLINPTIEKMAKATAEKIIKLNGDKSVNAVFVVGGGGKIEGYTSKVAKYLNIANERVAVRGEEVLTDIDLQVENFKKDSLYVTPVGICTNFYTQKNSFVFVTVNADRIKMYDNNHLTVVDAIMQVGYANEKLFPRRGLEKTFTVNGKVRLVRGNPGEGAIVKLNGKNANLNTSIEQNDVITVIESTIGTPALITVGQLEEFKSTLTFMVNDKKIICPCFAYVNDVLQSEYYEIQNGDNIKIENYYTVEQLFTFLDYDYNKYNVIVNNEKANKDTLVYENFSIKINEKPHNDAFKDENILYDDGNDDELSKKSENDTSYKEDNNVSYKEDNNVSYKEDNWNNAEVDTVKIRTNNGLETATNNVAESTTNDAAKIAINDVVETSANVTVENTANNLVQTTTNNTVADKDIIIEEQNTKNNENEEINKKHNNLHDIYVLINKPPVKLSGKSSYVLVDIFDFYEFDLSKVGGKKLVFTLNGKEQQYTTTISDGDVIDIYWEN